jgi:DNA-binding XRE family transcriptional regulator
MDHPLLGAYESCMEAYERSRMLRQAGRAVFGKELKQARRELGMTVREMGSVVGTTGALINQIETSSRSILKLEQVKKIVELCLQERNPSKQKADSKSVEESCGASPLGGTN